jgi:two-component system, NtrC family, response regulator AtoC
MADQWASQRHMLITRILALLNQWTGKRDVIGKILHVVKELTGFEGVGIRLRKGDDYPYCVTDGFPDTFIEAENSLCVRNEAGEILRDAEGIPILVCICGAVIQGRTNPDLPFFTEAGSFWTNSRSEFLSSGFADQLECGVRNRFKAVGCESVAIIRLRCEQETVGLLQLTDSRKNRLFPDLISSLENVGSLIGIVLARITTEERLSSAKDDLERLVEERTAELVASKALLEDQIQERIAVQQELRLSHERLELAMLAGNLGSWDWNLRTDEVFFDQRWSSMLGYAMNEAEPLVASWQNLLHRDDKLRVLKTLDRYLKDPSQPYETEYRLQSKSGEWRWILDRGKVVETDEKGKPLRMSGIYLDITNRKRTEEELHESAERCRGIFEGARDCIFVKNSALEYTQINPSFANLVALPESEIMGRTDRELFGKAASEILRETDRRVLKGETVEQEHTRPIKGVPATFLDIKVPMRNSQGKVVGIIGISREITERKRTESAPPDLEPDFDSPAMRSTLRAARLAAETDSIVLLIGESGSGKDHVARYIHKHSRRASGPFFFINCAAVSPELAESELFGYEAGAFTGARGPKRGLLELAEGGTILLNEIGELSLPLQAKLLTFLDTRQFTRVGGEKLLTVNARLITATNRDLEKEVEQKRFRQDLFYRLDVFTIEIPPLRKRAEDIPDLVSNILQGLYSAVGLESVPKVDPLALSALTEYHWPGNVRELRNVLERALIICDRHRIRLQDLTLNSKFMNKDADQEWAVVVSFPQDQSLNDVTMDVKKGLVKEALRRTDGSRKRAADLLGISVDSLKHYMRIFSLYG